VSSAAAPAAEGTQPAGQRGSSEASQQLQALAHHLMDEVSQVNGAFGEQGFESSMGEASGFTAPAPTFCIRISCFG